MDGTAARGPVVARSLSVLALLLGLLAMHGLASTHHAAAATHAVAPAVAAPEGDPAHTGGSGHLHASAAVDPGGTTANAVLTGPVSPSCDQGCRTVAVLCAAVLAGAAFALLVLRCRRAPLLLAPARRRCPSRAPPVRLARGPDPVEELCVSRT